MGIIRRPESVKSVRLDDVDTPIEDNMVCVVDESNNGNTIEIICVPEKFIEESKAEIKSKAIVTSTTTGEQFGTWIPVLRSTGTIDVNVRNAFYTKVGQLVICTFDIVITSMSGGKKDSSIVLGGLPVSSLGTPDTMSGSANISYFKVSNFDVRWISGTINGSETRVDLWCNKRGPGGLAPLTQLDININTVLAGTVTYISNS